MKTLAAFLLLASTALSADPVAKLTGPKEVTDGSAFFVIAEGSKWDDSAYSFLHPFSETEARTVPDERGPLLIVTIPRSTTKAPVKPGPRRIYFTASGIDENGNVKQASASIVVNVTVIAPCPPQPEPKPPGPKPPNPKPLPDGQFKIASKARAWAESVNRPSEAATLSGTFGATAAQIAAGALSGPSKIMGDVRKRTANALPTESRAHWETFTASLAEELKRLFDGGELKSNDDWATCFREIALGLKG